MSAAQVIFYEFGPFCLDPLLPLLVRDGQPVQLPPKALETLVALIERKGRVVSREELMRAVWPDSFVEENNLSVNVSLLRKALSEGADGAKYIETVPRRGYRFNAPVTERPADNLELIYTRRTRAQILIEESEEVGSDADAAVVATTAPIDALDVKANTLESTTTFAAARARVKSERARASRRRVALLAVVVLLIAVAGGARSLLRRGWQGEEGASEKTKGGVLAAETDRVRSLAVMPFRSIDGSDYSARSKNSAGQLTDAVRSRLGAANSLRLISANATQAAQLTQNNLLIAAHALESDAVLTGTLFKSEADEIYARFHLVSVGSGEVLWAETFRQPHSELPVLLEAIARNVEGGLQQLASADEYERRARLHTPSREAFQLYLQGRFIWEQRHDVFFSDVASLDEPSISINQLEQALSLDPNFALPHVALADHYKTSGYSSNKWRLAEEHAHRAAALDPNLAEAHATLGFIRMFHYWDWAGAETAFKRAIELNPNCVTARQWYALFHALRGDDGNGAIAAAESIQEIVRARELAPYSLSLLLDAAEMQYYARHAMAYNFGFAAKSLRHAHMLNPHSHSVRDLLVRSYWMNGEPEAAVALLGWQHGGPQDFARFYAGPRKGTRDFDNISPTDAYQHALWHAHLNQRAEALDLLERAFNDHHFFIIYLKAEPFFDNLRDEPRFQELLRKVGLKP